MNIKISEEKAQELIKQILETAKRNGLKVRNKATR
jgi:hypothetical protein